jgi:hypothetical protein
MRTFAPPARIGAEPRNSRSPFITRVPSGKVPSSPVRLGEPLEQEADRISDQIMQTPTPRPEGRSSGGGGCEHFQAKLTTGLPGRISKVPTGGSSGIYAPPRNVQDVLHSSGQPLDSATRAFMEPRFQHNFANVRIHSDAGAAESARSLNARAYSFGDRVVFAAGEYQPASATGRRLLAHELTHVLQQSDGGNRVQRQVDDAALEQCIAEQGGILGHPHSDRDAGIPNPEEIQRYREECLRRLGSTSSLSQAVANLAHAWRYTQERIGPEVRRELEGLFSPTSLAVMAGFAIAYIASQLTPVGWVADAFALAALTLTVIFVGTLAISVARDVATFFSAVNATTEEEFQESGYALARALARAGVGFVVAMLTRGLRGATRPPAGGPPPAPAQVQILATGTGITVPVRVAATAAEAVEASQLQALASYAVIVPPPGGTGPAAPRSSTSTGRGSGSSERPGAEPRGREAPPLGTWRGRVAYGEGPLSQLAQRLRLALGLRRGGNVAVFEFENVPDRFRAIVARSGGNNVRLEGNRMAVQNVSGSAHSEELAHMLITQGRNAGLQLTVRRIYTEYNPCTDTCLPLLRRFYPSAEISFSFVWERWGRETPDRNAAVDALFGGE